MAQSQSPRWRNICCNPFNKPNHFIRKKNQLRFVTKWMCEKASILPGERICDDCRKNLAKATALQIPDTCSIWGAVCLKITLGVDVYDRMRYLAPQSIFSEYLCLRSIVSDLAIDVYLPFITGSRCLPAVYHWESMFTTACGI